MQECLFSEPPGHEREPSWKPHQEVMPTAHSPTLPPPTLISSWCACMISFPSPVSPPTHPHYLLCWWENGEGVGDVPIGYAVHDTLIFQPEETWQDRISLLWQLRVWLSPAWLEVEESLVMWLTNMDGARSCRKKKQLLYIPSCPLFSFPTAHLWLGERMSINTAPAGWCLGL